MNRLLSMVVLAMVVLSAFGSSSGALESLQFPGVFPRGVPASQVNAHSPLPSVNSKPLQGADDTGFHSESTLDDATGAENLRTKLSNFDHDPTNLSNSSPSDWSTKDSRSTASHLRHDTQATLFTIMLDALATNLTFAQKLCPALSSSDNTGMLMLVSSPTAIFDIPDCLASAAYLLRFSGSQLRITKAAEFPPTLTLFNCGKCVFDSLIDGTAANGFESNGDIKWDDWWLHLPALTDFTLSNSDIRGALPNSLSSHLLIFTMSVNKNPLGPIPPTLFTNSSTVPRLQFTANGCGLSGEIPEGLFLPFEGNPLVNFRFMVTGNNLTGSLPPQLLAPLASGSLASLDFILTTNKLTGAFPSDFFPSGLVAPTGSSLSVDLSDNALTSLPSVNLISNLESIRFLIFNLENNRLTNVPSSIFNNVTVAPDATIYISLPHNDLAGTLPPSFLADGLSAANDGTISFFSFDLRFNSLDGSIPSSLLPSSSVTTPSAKRDSSESHHDADASSLRSSHGSASNALPKIDNMEIRLSNNKFTGSLPSWSFDFAELATRILCDLDNNRLTGGFPEALASALRSSSIRDVYLNARNNTLSGDVPMLCNGLDLSYIDLTDNLLNGTITSSYIDLCKSLSLFVGGNSNLTGSIPPALFALKSIQLDATNTNLNGTVPRLLNATSANLFLSGTSIDFCSDPLNVTTINFYTPTACKLANTSACDCQTDYDGCLVSCTPTEPMTTSPQPQPQLPPATCDLKTRPSPEFVCINGVWTATSTSSPVLTIPSGAGVVVVEGNVSSSTIIINGIGSKIIIGGCASNLSSIVIELSPEQVKQLEFTKSLQELLTLSNRTGNCSIDLNNVALTTKTSGCRKVSTEKIVSSNGNSLGAYFVVSSSGCNTWWIVLVSVIVVVVILGTAAAIVGGILWKRHTEKKDFNRLQKG